MEQPLTNGNQGTWLCPRWLASRPPSALQSRFTHLAQSLTTSLAMLLRPDRVGLSSQGELLIGPDVRARVALSVSSSLTSLSRSLAASYRLASPRPLLAQTGSCNAVPMGIIAAQTKMPSCKFVNPKNLDTIPANQDFTVQMAINNVRLAG